MCAGDLAATVYATLRSIAQQQMRGERCDHTLTATALVHEAFIRLSGQNSTGSPGAPFCQAASQAMRHILIDHARKRKAQKRGGDRQFVGDVENVVQLAVRGDPEDILALDEAVVRLEQEDPDAAGVVRLRFYAGLTGDQTAKALGISPRQADREWAYARAFLLRALQDRSDA